MEAICSIVILTYNNLDFTRLCMEELLKNTPSIPHELILVDNASRDGTRAYLEGLTAPNLIRIYNEANLGFARGCNQGAARARGKYLIFLNNDMIPQKGWLDEMVKAIEIIPKVGAVGSLLLYPDGTIQHAGVVFGRPYFTIHLHKGKKRDYAPARIPKILQAVTGACLLVPRPLFEQAGGFDEGYRNGFEDLDLCFKIRSLGYRVLYWPQSILVHFESVSEGRHQHDPENLSRFQHRWKAMLKLDAEAMTWAEYPDRLRTCLQDSLLALASLEERF